VSKPLRKGFAICPACSAVIRERRLPYHHLTPECLVAVAARAMEERGYEKTSGYSMILRRAGFDIANAPIGFVKHSMESAHAAQFGPHNVTIGTYATEDGTLRYFELTPGWWARKEVVRATRALAHMTVAPPERRWALVRRMVADEAVYEEIRQAVDVLRGAGKKIVPKEW
jgi:hypothetical protein